MFGDAAATLDLRSLLFLLGSRLILIALLPACDCVTILVFFVRDFYWKADSFEVLNCPFLGVIGGTLRPIREFTQLVLLIDLFIFIGCVPHNYWNILLSCPPTLKLIIETDPFNFC